jgi:cytochrome c553
MKKQTSVLMAAIVLLGMMFTTASAEIKKGQKTYLKKCKKCHGNGTKGSAMQTQDQWAKFFNNGAAKIIEAHKGTKAEEYFNGKRFKKKAPHLKDFLWQYGSDSGNVPSCG